MKRASLACGLILILSGIATKQTNSVVDQNRIFQMQQRHQTQAKLFKMYEERQNLNAAMETAAKNKPRLNSIRLPQARESERFFAERKAGLMREIRDLESQLATHY